MNLIIDGFAIIPTIKKSFLRPKSENFWAWFGTGLGDFVNLLAVEKLAFVIILYPAWMLFNDLIVIYLLGQEKRKNFLFNKSS